MKSAEQLSSYEGLVTTDLPSASDAMAVSGPPVIAVVIPCYRVVDTILDVIAGVPSFVRQIHVVDDACPEGSGRHVIEHCADSRVAVHFNEANLGVGGAVMAGYEAALAAEAGVIVKMDGDGQMDPAALAQLIAPILGGHADYAKGNRFYDLDQIGRMPRLRIVGNAILSFLTKISSGYWDVFDPTNGYTAIHGRVLARLPLRKISRRYFFETDMLFRLNIMRAVVADVPMDARYGAETSNLKVSKVLLDFSLKHLRNAVKRVFYSYFLRDLSLASLELISGLGFVLVGASMGFMMWLKSSASGIPTLPGSVTLVALLIIVGIQLLLGFLAYDIANVPKRVQYLLLDTPFKRKSL